MPELIKDGHVYLAMPPLYQVTRNKKNYYAYSDEELNKILTEIGRDNQNKIQRYKVLGKWMQVVIGNNNGSNTEF